MARHSDPEGRHTELVPDIFDTGTEKLPSSGQFSAAMLAGCLIAATEALVVPAIFAGTVAVSVLTWWILDAPWAGRRRRSSRAVRKWYFPQPRTVYLSTLMLVGLWLATMFVFRASDPGLSSGFSSTLPDMMLGMDVSVLSKMNGMRGPLDTGPATVLPRADDVAPFSLFAHGTASTVAVALLTYAFQTARRRIRRARRSRDLGEQHARHSGAAR
jgi:hypothetical protein